ncbi:MAG: Rhomboid family protein [Rhodospirillales bacterium]|nr:Rhomboid family protein [Rhodospirillales bacterium]
MTKGLLIANVAVHVVRLLLPPQLDDALLLEFAFIPARYTIPGAFHWTALLDPVTYQFLHGSLLHLGMNMLALLAFGSGVERRIGGWRMLIFALLCGIAAAATHFAVYPTSPDPVIGFSGALSGLFGGILRFIARRGGTRLWPMVVVWLVMNVVTGETGMAGGDGEIIAWVAHTGGFVAGLALFGLFDRRERDAA